MKRDSIDFHQVEDRHAAIHKRLVNWARWCNGGGAASTSPMFRLYRTPARGREDAPAGVPIDHKDASAIAKGVTALPEPHRHALNWAYVKPTNPRAMASKLGVSHEGLARLVNDGRTMLVNRQA